MADLIRPRRFLVPKVLAHFPTLRVETSAELLEFVGMFPVRSEGGVLDEFQVVLTLPPEFPRVMPSVRELGSRVPRGGEHDHVNPDGTLCVILPDEYWLGRDECDLVEFLEGPLTNYFIGFLHFIETGSWPFGEHAHGHDGVRDFYARLLGTEDMGSIHRYLDVLRRRDLRQHWPCPCGSEKRLGRCHWLKVVKLRQQVRPRLAADAILRLTSGA